MPRIDDPTQKDRYKICLVQFMAFRDGTNYNKDHEFTQQELSTITPEQLRRWMCVKVYGVEDPGPDDHPTVGRSSSLDYYKKAISFFMPNHLPQWNVLTHSGNPTKLSEVNDLIKAVKKKEVRRQGKPSAARRALEASEFEQCIEMMEAHPDPMKRYFGPAVFGFQYNMIGRIDDTCKFQVADLKPNPQYPFTLKARMCWSKNVMEERDAPDQLLLGAMDQRYCVLVGLSVYLEIWIASGDGQGNNPLLFGIGG